jgi:hypothetical protein
MSMTWQVKFAPRGDAVLDPSGHRFEWRRSFISGRGEDGPRAERMMEDLMNEAQQLADRYVAAWNETDAGRRRQAIESLWTADGEHYVDTRQAVGHAALEARIKGSFEKNVVGAGNRFRALNDARRLHDAVTFHWQMLPKDSEAVLATGFEFLVTNDDGRILVDYQFVL